MLRNLPREESAATCAFFQPPNPGIGIKVMVAGSAVAPLSAAIDLGNGVLCTEPTNLNPPLRR